MGFTRHEAIIVGTIILPLTIETWPRIITEMIKFLVIDTPPAYSGILEGNHKLPLEQRHSPDIK